MITKGPPLWDHQREACSYIHKHRGSLLWIPMRRGKTRIAIDYIQNTGDGPTLIVCPHKVIGVWAEQFRQYLAEPEETLVKALDTQTVAERADAVLLCMRHCPDHTVFITNYDVIATEPLAKVLLGINWQNLIFDEVHRLQAAGGKQSRFAARLAKNARKIVGLSGTPGNPLGNPKKPEMRQAGIIDIYGVMRTLAPGLFARNYNDFKQTFGVWNPHTPFPMIMGYRNQARFDAALAQVCFHVADDDIKQPMPPTIAQIIPITLPPLVQAAYNTLEKEMTADFGADSITAGNQLVTQLRLQQMTAGFLQPDGTETPIPVHTEKIDAIAEIIADLPDEERTLIFCQFKPEMDAITAKLKGHRPVFHIRGGLDTSAQWKATPGACLVVQIQAGGEGLDLSATNYVFYASLCHSLRFYQQSYKRPQIANKSATIVYYSIIAQGTVDEDIFASLEAKEEVVASVRQRLQQRSKGQ
jgi:SNF2 family DNA or RNA helicase